MSRMTMIPESEASGDVAEVYGAVKKGLGKIPNAYATIASHSPKALQAMLGADKALAGGSLSKKDQETIKLVISEVAGCDYCVAAHTLVGKMAGLSQDEMRRARAGSKTGDDQRNALVSFVRTLATSSGTLGQAEYQAIVDAGYSDAQIVDICLAIAVITFTNAFNRINDTYVDFPKVD
ncbi:carboxymuconolactone decarboxylase family protein [Celeribacter sp.]|uniref:carboxymuconolactone decarboxylase family protein n=1 Tax=Celeribacter sp. TaxID=1890673 RepID=UPI003A8E3BAD